MVRGQKILPASASLHFHIKESLIIMKSYIKPKLTILFLLLSTLVILAASPDDMIFTSTAPARTGSAISYAMKEEKPVKELPLPENENIEDFAYNAVTNSLCAISHSRNTYRLFVLDIHNQWRFSSQWKVSSGEKLLHFVYDPDGALYACRKITRKKKSTQSLVRLRGNGRISKVTLQDLDRVPKKSSRVSHDIADIQFSGTALAITYCSHAVKFYNIAEGHALGSSSVTGTAGQNIFYDHHYLSLDNKSHSSTLHLNDHDIRTGEIEQTIPLTVPASSGKEVCLSHYREKIYLLSADGLFSGSCPEMILSKRLSTSQLALPSESRILSVYAARDDALYITYLDNAFSTHLITFTIDQLDSSPSL